MSQLQVKIVLEILSVSISKVWFNQTVIKTDIFIVMQVVFMKEKPQTDELLWTELGLQLTLAEL